MWKTFELPEDVLGVVIGYRNGNTNIALVSPEQFANLLADESIQEILTLTPAQNIARVEDEKEIVKQNILDEIDAYMNKIEALTQAIKNL
jgi:5,10-methenyltetrahydromethanopterin hydrogenase